MKILIAIEKKRRSFLFVVMGLSLAMSLSACGSTTDLIEYVERPVEEIYNDAFEEFERGNFQVAALQFDEVERQHPYSKWARRAMIMSAYTYYLQNQYEETIMTAQRFVALYPGNSSAAYAYYLIAQSYYEQISDVQRDQRMTELAQQSFVELIRRFPNTDYARDGVLKLDLTLDHLAGKEMEVGRYYLNRGQYAAAIQRFSLVIEKYQRTTHAAEALHRLTELYVSLGIEHEAQTSAAILGHNFPDSDWYADSYRILVERDLEPIRHEGSWLSKIWQTVF